MKSTRAIAALLSVLMASGSVPQSAIAQVIGTVGGSAAGASSGLSGAVPRIELTGGFSQLSPAPGMAPSLLGGIPALNAPSIAAPQSVNPFSAIPVLPLSAVAVAAAPQGPSLTAFGRGTSSPYGSVAA